jgi:hypothetical protein
MIGGGISDLRSPEKFSNNDIEYLNRIKSN